MVKNRGNTIVMEPRATGVIMPVGTNEDQRLMRYRKDKSGKISSDAVGLSNFLHLVEGAAKEL